MDEAKQLDGRALGEQFEKYPYSLPRMITAG